MRVFTGIIVLVVFLGGVGKFSQTVPCLLVGSPGRGGGLL